MANITKLIPKNGLPDIDKVLELAKGEFEDALVIGWTKGEDSILGFRTSSIFTHADLLWLIEQFKIKLLNGDYLDKEGD